MPSSNLIDFSTRHLEGTIFVRVIYLLRKSYSKYSDVKEKTRNTLVNVKRPLGTPEGHFVLCGIYMWP